MAIDNPPTRIIGRSKAFETYIGASAIAFFLSYVATYAYSFYYGRMAFDGQFHPGSDFPGSLVDPAVHNPDKYNVGVHFFGDFWTTLLRSAEPSPYMVKPGLGGSSYPPFAQFIYKPLTWIPYPLALSIFLIGSVLIVSIPFWRALKAYTPTLRIAFIVVGVLLTYPFLFSLDRGNNIGLTAGVLLFGVLALYEDRPRHAAIFFAIAAALKIYPVFFLLIFVSRRQWRHLWTAIWVGTTLTVIPLLTYAGGPIENAKALYRNSSYFRDAGEQIALNHSLYAWFLTIRESNWGFVSRLAGEAVQSYTAIAALIVVAATIAIAFLKSTRAIGLLTLCVFLNTALIPITYGYTLVVFVCIGLAISFEYAPDKRLLVASTALGLLLCSKGIPVGPPTAALFSYLNIPLQVAIAALTLVPQRALSASRKAPI